MSRMQKALMDCFGQPRRDFSPEEAEIVEKDVTFRRRNAAGTTEVRLERAAGVYKGLRIFVFDEVRAPFATEWRIFKALQALGNFVAICYHPHRALDVVQNYLALERGQEFAGDGVCIFKRRECEG